jgi:hypothetical protein
MKSTLIIGVDNTGVDNASLYTQPEDIWDVYRNLAEVGPYFSIAAAFGNVHGVYKPGNVRLHPELLGKHQAYTQEQLKCKDDKPLYSLLTQYSLIIVSLYSTEVVEAQKRNTAKRSRSVLSKSTSTLICNTPIVPE